MTGVQTCALPIYFPNPAIGHQKYLSHDYPESAEKLADKVVRQVLEYSTSQRMDMLYTWSGVNNALLRDRFRSKKDELAAAESARRLSESAMRMKAYEADLRVQSAEHSVEQMRQQVDEFRTLARENSELVESVDEEMETMRQQIEFLTRQNESLSYEVQGLRGKIASLSSKPILYLGGEDEFFNREITEWILIALSNELKNTKANTRDRKSVV